MSENLSVRELAEFVCRSGDLYAHSEGKSIDMRDGIRVQEAIRARRRKADANYASEVAVKQEFNIANVKTRLSGRIDGVMLDESKNLIEEYKACAYFPGLPNAIDLGQLMIYAAMFSIEKELTKISLSLVYVDADTLEERAFQYKYDGQTLKLLLAFMLLCYELPHLGHLNRTIERGAWARFRAFPYSEFRYGQRALAGRVYRAASLGEQLLIESPTGSGKTLGTIYPMLKALGHQQKIFYLTSRNSGSIAAQQAVKILDPSSDHLISIEITAKEKICPVEGMPCDAESCEYAKGYFDRAKLAVSALLDKHLIDRSRIEAVSEEFTVCPFELSLDASLWVDIVICDYNYVFDPFVRLQRFQPPKGIHLLIDEAHQLFPRVNSMYTVELSSVQLEGAIQNTPPQLSSALLEIGKEMTLLASGKTGDEFLAGPPEKLNMAILRMLSTLEESEIELTADYDVVRLFAFSCYRWSSAQDWPNAECFSYIIDNRQADLRIRYSCIDSSRLIGDALSNYESSVCFSGTLSPLELYQELHGGEDNLLERSPNPFSADQVKVLVINDISTYYQARERGLADLINLVRSVLDAKPGRYLIAFPSFEYLELFLGALTVNEDLHHEILKQAPAMQLTQAHEILEAFKNQSAALLGVVLGGVLAESIDFLESNIDGIFVVSLGLPPPSLERDLMAERFKDFRDYEWGQTAAYRQPALNKVLQVCGRLIRSPSHRGMLYLVDPRYASARIQSFFPSHWDPVVCQSSDVIKLTRQFWNRRE